MKGIQCKNSTYLCQNGGTCYNTTLANNTVIAYRCTCPTGFHGSLCELSNIKIFKIFFNLF